MLRSPVVCTHRLLCVLLCPPAALPPSSTLVSRSSRACRFLPSSSLVPCSLPVVSRQVLRLVPGRLQRVQAHLRAAVRRAGQAGAPGEQPPPHLGPDAHHGPGHVDRGPLHQASRDRAGRRATPVRARHARSSAPPLRCPPLYGMQQQLGGCLGRCAHMPTTLALFCVPLAPGVGGSCPARSSPSTARCSASLSSWSGSHRPGQRCGSTLFSSRTAATSALWPRPPNACGTSPSHACTRARLGTQHSPPPLPPPPPARARTLCRLSPLLAA